MSDNYNYEWDPNHKFVVEAAIELGRPLLVRGEPGVGKSSLARAAAIKYGRTLISEVVTARTEPNDLMWQFDGVKRLSDAQLKCSLDDNDKKCINLDKENYLSPGILWWAFQPEQAASMYEKCKGSCCPSLHYNKEQPVNANGWVVLIDEIDKADSDVPNSMLEALAEGKFEVPYLDDPVAISAGVPNPLIIITTNEERELPKAFLRRCLVLQMAIPDEKKGGNPVKWLVDRAIAHKFSNTLPLDDIAKFVLKDREGFRGRYKPGLSEYLDFVSAFDLSNKSKNLTKDQANDIFETISSFTLKKDAL
ncbi:MoxR family ATPase [Maridesulfovibrio sp.]|uniref:AAA family ATPase n=1 Tax=Maridesulfovibrio sp. TaxID=2795000 RepID=UPI002A18C207|nr:MoxR family ATPase [Maridesulfovibrio sp.]